MAGVKGMKWGRSKLNKIKHRFKMRRERGWIRRMSKKNIKRTYPDIF